MQSTIRRVIHCVFTAVSVPRLPHVVALALDKTSMEFDIKKV